MNISILTVFQELYNPFLQTSLVNRAQEKGLVSLDVESLFSFVAPKERIDAPTAGHGVGMLIRPNVVEKAVNSKQQAYGEAFKVFFSPQGKKLDQRLLQSIAEKAQQKGHLMLLPARYEGMDARVEQYYADETVSVGDFVLMGGDIPAMMLLEGVLRLLPGVVGKVESVQEESFTGPFVDYPEYTEPVEWKGMKIPDVVRSGNHAALNAWRKNEAARKTVQSHFSWLRSTVMNAQEKALAQEHIPHHYIALMHEEVLIGEDRVIGTTSVTSLDLHDIARSAKTYGLKNFFIVTPLIDQQRIVRRMLDFWLTEGADYNRQRYEAVKQVCLHGHLEEVIARIEEIEGVKPVIIATSARDESNQNKITFYDQTKVWAERRPVLFVLGTGKGLTKQFIDASDFVLVPVEGFSDFKHLSVRSAAAIIFDRWLGINPKNAG